MIVYGSIVCGCFYIGFVDFIFIGKRLTDIKNSFFPNKFRDKDKRIWNHFLKNYQISETLPMKLRNIALQLVHIKIDEIKNYSVFSQRKTMSKGFNNYIAAFDYSRLTKFACRQKRSSFYFFISYYWCTSWESKCNY